MSDFAEKFLSVVLANCEQLGMKHPLLAFVVGSSHSFGVMQTEATGERRRTNYDVAGYDKLGDFELPLTFLAVDSEGKTLTARVEDDGGVNFHRPNAPRSRHG